MVLDFLNICGRSHVVQSMVCVPTGHQRVLLYCRTQLDVNQTQSTTFFVFALRGARIDGETRCRARVETAVTGVRRLAEGAILHARARIVLGRLRPTHGVSTVSYYESWAMRALFRPWVVMGHATIHGSRPRMVTYSVEVPDVALRGVAQERVR